MTPDDAARWLEERENSAIWRRDNVMLVDERYNTATDREVIESLEREAAACRLGAAALRREARLREVVSRLRLYVIHNDTCEMADPRGERGSLRFYINPPEVSERRETRCTCELHETLVELDQILASDEATERT